MLDRRRHFPIFFHRAPCSKKLHHTEGCHGGDDLSFWLAQTGESFVLVNPDQGGNDPEHGNDEGSVEAVPEMLTGKTNANKQGSAKKDRHQHFSWSSCRTEAFPLGKSSHSKDDEAEGVKDGEEHALIIVSLIMDARID